MQTEEMIDEGELYEISEELAGALEESFGDVSFALIVFGENDTAFTSNADPEDLSDALISIVRAQAASGELH